MAEQRAHRRRFAVSLRAMLGGVFIFALALGLWINDARQQQAAIATIWAFDINAHIEYENDDDQGDSVGWTVWAIGGRSSWLTHWMVGQLGRDYFHSVAWVQFGQNSPAANAHRRDEVIQAVTRLRGLVGVNLGGLDINDADIAKISGIRNLKWLQLGGGRIRLTDAALRTISRKSSLESLSISDAPITDLGLAYLGQLPRLKTLRLGSSPLLPRIQSRGPELFPSKPFKNWITGSGFAGPGAFPALGNLHLYSSALTGEGLRSLGSLDRIAWLEIMGGSITDDDLRHLAPLHDLEVLSIMEVNLDGTGFRHLAGLAKLAELEIHYSTIDDSAIPFLEKLPVLRSLKLFDTRVTDSGLIGLRALPRFKPTTGFISVELSGTLPDAPKK